MKITLTNNVTTEQFAKRFFYLLYEACGGPLGMGIFQARKNVSEEDVWNNVKTSGDYGGNKSETQSPYGDYVFGRMMKFGCKIKDNQIEFRDGPYDSEYQSWCILYTSSKEIADKVCESLGCSYSVLSS